MSSPYNDRVIKRLNFGSDVTTPHSLVAAQLGPRSRLPPPAARSPGAATHRVTSTGVVRYGLPEDELPTKERCSGTRSVSYRVPSDDESDSEPEVTSSAHADTLSRPDAVEEQRQLLQQQLLASLENIQRSKQASWRSRLAEVEVQLAAQLSALATSSLRKQSDLQREDQELLLRQQQKRNEVLERVQSTHRTEASLQEQQVKRFVEQREEERRKEEERRRKEEEERRREQERLEAERERKRKEKEEAERKRKEDDELRMRQEVEAEKQRKRAEKEQKRKEQEAADAAKAQGHGAGHPCLRVSPGAQRQAADLAARLAAVESAVRPLQESEATKKQRRDIEKKLTVHVQQICGTQSQVQTKCQDVYNLLSALQGPWRSFAVLTLCNKIVKQYELVQLNHKAAFPLALVVVKVSQVVPELLELLLALIQKACPLAVPMSYEHDINKISNNNYYRGMRFEEQDDPSTLSGKVFESTEEYTRRLEGLMLLYGAIMQVDDPNCQGIQHGWLYMARALNYLPRDRYTAKALISVLRAAGYSMHVRFGRQFVKLLLVLQREFLPALRKAAGDDISALAALLDSYVSDGLYRKPPEGRNLPAFDISSLAENRA